MIGAEQGVKYEARLRQRGRRRLIIHSSTSHMMGPSQYRKAEQYVPNLKLARIEIMQKKVRFIILL
jgi:hypothetical protein